MKNNDVQIRRKLVLVGDSACGKTSLITACSGGEFSTGFIHHMNVILDIEVDGQQVGLAPWDVPGYEDPDLSRLRPLYYTGANTILICFAIDSPGSLGNVVEKRTPEVLHFKAGAPLVLVGCKSDTRGTSGHRCVTREEGMAVAQKIGARQYLECSAKTGEGVQEVFRYAYVTCAELGSQSAMSRLRSKLSSCMIS